MFYYLLVFVSVIYYICHILRHSMMQLLPSEILDWIVQIIILTIVQQAVFQNLILIIPMKCMIFKMIILKQVKKQKLQKKCFPKINYKSQRIIIFLQVKIENVFLIQTSTKIETPLLKLKSLFKFRVTIKKKQNIGI